MKTLLLLWVISLSGVCYSQVNDALVPEAKLFYQKANEQVRPEIRDLVNTIAQKLKGRNVYSDRLLHQLKQEKILAQLDRSALDGVLLMILVKSSYDADAELKQLAMHMPKEKKKEGYNLMAPIINRKSQIARDANALIEKYAGNRNLVLEALQ